MGNKGGKKKKDEPEPQAPSDPWELTEADLQFARKSALLIFHHFIVFIVIMSML